MPGPLRRLVERTRGRELRRVDDEYRTMTPEEREEAEAVRWRGAEGEREIRVERAAERDEEAREGRPMHLWRYVSGNGWFTRGRPRPDGGERRQRR